MNPKIFVLAAAAFAFIGLPGCSTTADMSCCTIEEPVPNTLTVQEKNAGWRLLWDGRTTDGWRSAFSQDFPKQSWQIKNGESQADGDIITREKFSSFELKVDFKITTNCNSGIKYFVHPDIGAITATGEKSSTGSAIGYEFQILDDARHPDAKLGLNGDRKLGSLYDLLPASENKKVNLIGEWNTARIIVRGNHVEHWLNDVKILEYDRASPEFKAAFAQSKFKDIPDFPAWTDGNILLQEHGSQVSFRNIKIRALPAN